MYTNKGNKIPDEYMCVDGQMLIAAKGQFVLVEDYQNLLHRYKRLLKLCHLKGVFKAMDTKKKARGPVFGNV